MTVTYVEHTADVRFRVSASSVKSIFSESMYELMKIMRPVPISNSTRVKRVLQAESLDSSALVIDFLNEALSMAVSFNEVYDRVEIDQLTGKSITTTVLGSTVDGFNEDVKAVTYHGAELIKSDDGRWEITIILDV